MPVPPRRLRLRVAVPASTGLAEHSRLLRSYKWGVIARLLAVYRVDEVVVYIDRPGSRRLAEEAITILEYLVVAPYLRRRVYPPDVDALRYAGALPPLQLPTHGAGGPRAGECREALVLRRLGDSGVVDAGLGRPVRMRGLSKAPRAPGPGERILVCIESLRPPRLRPARPGEVYAGYRVRLAGSLVEAASGGLVVATSRYGERVSPPLLEEIGSRASSLGDIVVLFGAPDAGLSEIARREGREISEISDYILNTVPGQGTRTVRVEEALSATLALLNIYLGEPGMQ